MTEICKQTVQKDGEMLSGILKQQKTHHENLEKKINIDLKVAENYQDRMCSGCLKYGILACLLALMAVGILFYVMKN